MTGVTIEQHDDMPSPVMMMHLLQKCLEILSPLSLASFEQTMSGFQIQAAKYDASCIAATEHDPGWHPAL
jgi:hypothetical protein